MTTNTSLPSKRRRQGRLASRRSGSPPELLDELVKGPMTAAEVESVCRSFKQAFLQRAMGAELTEHLGYEKGDAPAAAAATAATGRARRRY